MMGALDPSFDAAILHMVSTYLPGGFDVAEQAPNDWPSLKAHWRGTGRILVWSGASERTIFGAPGVNHAFRAWHAYCHLMVDADFSLEGEIITATRQVMALRREYMPGVLLARWCRLVQIEVIGQAQHFAATGGFPVNQRAFTARAYMRGDYA